MPTLDEPQTIKAEVVMETNNKMPMDFEAPCDELAEVDFAPTMEGLLDDELEEQVAMKTVLVKKWPTQDEMGEHFLMAGDDDDKGDNDMSRSESDDWDRFFLEDSHAPRATKRARTDGSVEDYIDIKKLPPMKRNETSFTIVETTTFQLMVNRLHQIGNDASEVATRLYGAKSVTNCSDFIKTKAEYLAEHNDERFMFGEFGLWAIQQAKQICNI